ncbi:MAG TPA: hypothetical protein VGI20_13375 [Rhizomicrobium sp.]|jgi:hypothetical protein
MSKDYEVGHGKPPVHTRFKKGVSGNPSGRPGPKKLVFGRLLLAIEWAMMQEPETVAAKLAQTSDQASRIGYASVLAAARGERETRKLILSLVLAGAPEMARRMGSSLRDEMAAFSKLASVSTVRPSPQKEEFTAQ